MITCIFEKGSKVNLRHVVTHSIVEKDGAILLEKRTGDILESGKWALPGGFLERGETVAEGTLRELREETGWEGEIVSLFRINSSPNRPHEDRENIAFEFIVEPLKQAGSADLESSKVEWIPVEKLLPFEQFAFDHGETIRLYLKYREKPFDIPLLV